MDTLLQTPDEAVDPSLLVAQVQALLCAEIPELDSVTVQVMPLAL